MGSYNQFEKLNDLANQEQIKHHVKIVQIMAKARALQIRGKISDAEYNEIRDKLDYGKLVNVGLEEYIDNILYYHYGLIDIYSKAIDLYAKYKTGYLPLESFPSFEQEMEEFFKYIGCYQLYKRIKNRHMIINDPKATLNVCINGGKTSYIVLKKPFISTQKPKESTIVHEMGHAYCYNVLADTKPTLFARDINSEIISLLFERLFLDFLLENTSNHELVKTIIRNFETNQLNSTKNAKKILEIFDDPLAKYTLTGAAIKYTKKGKEQKSDLYGQLYAIGNIASASLFNGYKQAPEDTIKYLPELIRYTSDTTFSETLVYCSDVKPLDRCLENRLVLKPREKDA